MQCEALAGLRQRLDARHVRRQRSPIDRTVDILLRQAGRRLVGTGRRQGLGRDARALRSRDRVASSARRGYRPPSYEDALAAAGCRLVDGTPPERLNLSLCPALHLRIHRDEGVVRLIGVAVDGDVSDDRRVVVVDISWIAHFLSQ